MKTFHIPKKIKTLSGNLLLFLISGFLSLLVVEGICRILYDPIDYLEPELTDDPVLSYTIRPHSTGHDKWGFRNKTLPEKVDIVTIGDSQTYGINATASENWPSSLQQISGKSICNLSLGGYGTADYLYLLETKAIIQNPEVVIIGLYLGNDLFDTCRTVYLKDHWVKFRDPVFLHRNPEINHSNAISEANRLKYFRNWLSKNSIFYRLFTHSRLGSWMRGIESSSKDDSAVSYLHVAGRDVSTIFTPERLKFMDLSNISVKEGLRISLQLIEEMISLCRKHHIRLVFAIIPTKISVYADFIRNDPKIHRKEELLSIIANEQKARVAVAEYLARKNIHYIDLLMKMQHQLPEKRLYPSSNDGHPNSLGYQIIAEAIAEDLFQRITVPRAR